MEHNVQITAQEPETKKRRLYCIVKIQKEEPKNPEIALKAPVVDSANAVKGLKNLKKKLGTEQGLPTTPQ